MFRSYIETEDFLTVPMSGNLYEIDINARIRNTGDRDAFFEVVRNEEGELTAWLLLWNGWAYYKLAEIMALTFKPIHIPIRLWNRLTVLFLNGDKTMLHPANLVWKFPVGLECSKYPGYAYIPCFSRYVINREGEMIDFLSGKRMRFFKNNSNYFCCRIKPDAGIMRNGLRHRLLAMAWLDYPVDADKLVVNHLNGIRGSDAIHNLEWATYKRNSDHAYQAGLRKDNNHVLSRNIKTGEIIDHYSQAECARYLSINPATLWECLRMEDQPLFTGFIQLKYSNDDTPWRDPTQEEIEKIEFGSDITVVGRNLKTGEIREFVSQSAIIREFGITGPNLWESVRNKEQRVWPNYWQFQLKRELGPWRTPDNIEEERDRSAYGNAVLARNVKTGEIREYVSAITCAKDFGLCDLTISVRLRDSSQKVYPGYWQFKRKADSTPWREVDDPDSKSNRSKQSVPIDVRDIFTGETWHFNALAEVEKIGLPLHIADQRLYSKFRLPYLNFEVKHPAEGWPSYSQQDLSLFKQAVDAGKPMKGRGWLIRDVVTGEERLYADSQQFYNDFKVSKPHACSLARAGKLFQNKWLFQPYFSNESCPGVISVTEPS